LAFIFDGLSGCGFPHPNAIAFYSLTAGPNSGVHLKDRAAIFGLREETTLQARLRDCLFPQTSEPESRFCLFSLRRPLAAEIFLSLVVQTIRSCPPQAA